MSFVGPRALMPDEIEVNSNGEPTSLKEIPGYSERHQVLPGLTGLAQVYLPRDTPRRDKFRYDLAYVRSQSLWLNLKFTALSFWITFRGKWEYRGRKFYSKGVRRYEGTAGEKGRTKVREYEGTG